MRKLTALKYDNSYIYSKLQPPAGYQKVIYTFAQTEKIIALKNPVNKRIYAVSPSDIENCRIKTTALVPYKHIATEGIYEAWDIYLELIPLSKIAKQCKPSLIPLRIKGKQYSAMAQAFIDQWIIASVLGLIFLAIFGRKYEFSEEQKRFIKKVVGPKSAHKT
jgi:hypothetical protein